MPMAVALAAAVSAMRVNGRVKVSQRAAQNVATLGLRDCRLACASIRATALITELAVARMLWPVRANCLRCACGLSLVLAGLALAQAIAFAVHLKDVHVVGQAVQQRTG